MSARTRNILLGALSLGVIVVTFAFVLPRIANYRDVWEVVQDLDPVWLVALSVAVLVNVVTFAPPWVITLPGLRVVQALLFTQASTAFTYIAPGGGLVGMAGSFGLLRAWGFESGPVARAVALTGIWNQLSNLLLPVIAVLLLSIEEQQDAVLTTAAVVGGIAFAVAVGVLVLVFWSDQLAHDIGRLAARVVDWALALVRRGPVVGWPEGLAEFRSETVRLVQRRWWLLTIATIVGNLAVFAIFLISLRAVGIGSSQITWIEAFAGWSLARVLQLIPLTPGGLGPVELGLTGILVGLGGPNAAVVAAVLLYRACTILPTLLFGSATIVGWRWLAPPREEGDPALRGTSRPVREQSHKDEMSAAIRGDFERLRHRGVASTLAPPGARA